MQGWQYFLNNWIDTVISRILLPKNSILCHFKKTQIPRNDRILIMYSFIYLL